jgi:ssDNA-binding replication factor A large subunit
MDDSGCEIRLTIWGDKALAQQVGLESGCVLSFFQSDF